MNSQFSSRIKEKLYLSASLFQLFHFRTPNDFHIFLFLQKLQSTICSPEAFSPVYKKNLPADFRQQQRIIQCSISASNHCCVFSLIKGTVTGNAVGNSISLQLFTSWNHKSPMRSSCCINHCFCFQTASGLQLHLKIFFRFCNAFGFVLQDFNLVQKSFSQLISADSRQTRIIVNTGTFCDLPGSLIFLFQKQNVQICSFCINCSSNACWSASDNQHIFHFLPPIINHIYISV